MTWYAPLRLFCAVLTAVLGLLAATPAPAGEAAPAPSGPASPPGEAEPDGGGPRGSIAGFLVAARAGDFARAAEYLDLRRIPAAERARRGPELARDLKIVLDRTLWVDLDALDPTPEGDTTDGLRPGVDKVGAVTTGRGPVDILVERVPGEGGQPTWKVAARTVAQIPALYEEHGYGPLYEILPEPLVTVRVLEVALWQWIGLVLLLAAVWLLSGLLRALLLRVMRPFAARSRTTVDDDVLASFGPPLRLFIVLALFQAGLLALGLAVPVHRVLSALVTGIAVFAGAWALTRAVDVLARHLALGLAARGRTSATAVMPVVRRVAKVVVAVLAAIVMLQNLGVNVTAVLAGLGVGGLAVALAAQKTVENLFGGITLIMDQPIRVGDFCRFGGTIGTVEDIGLRSTRIRTLDRTVVSVPNAEFASMQLENFARRDRIWLSTILGLRYETTPDQLRYVLVEVRRMLYAHPRVIADGARIRFVAFGAHSLDLEIFAYVDTMDFGEFVAIREDIFLRIMDIVAASGTGFAIPSQTLYLGRDSGLDADRSRAAEAQVAAWRAEGRLPLPEFPAHEVQALKGTLRYPADGAVTQAP